MFLGHTSSAGKYSVGFQAQNAAVYESLTIQNAVFDEVYGTTKVIENFDGTAPKNWTFETILHALFQNDLLAGNVNFTEELVQEIRIKRRTPKDTSFKTIYTKTINKNEDFSIELMDYAEPSGTIEYAYVPVISGGEGDYIISKVISAFNSYFLCEKDLSFPMILDSSYSQTVNYDTASVKPLGRKYPVSIVNGNTGYKSGEMECLFIELDGEKAKTSEILSYRELLYQTLINGKPKILKDMEGNLLLISISGSITESDRQYLYDSSQGFYYVKSKFSWVECGNAYETGDLYDSNFINTDLDRR